MRNPSKYCTAEGPGINRRKFQLLADSITTIGLRLHNLGSFPYPLGYRNTVEIILYNIKIIGKVTYFLINIKSLTEKIDSQPVLPLEFEKVPFTFAEILEIPVIKDNSGLITKNYTVGIKAYTSDLIGVKIINTRNPNRRVNFTPFLKVLKSKLCNKCSLSGAFGAENKKKPVRIPELDTVVNHIKEYQKRKTFQKN